MALLKAVINIFSSVEKLTLVNCNSFFKFRYIFHRLFLINLNFSKKKHILLHQISEKASNTNLSRPNLKHASIIFSAEQFRNRPDYIIFNCLIAWIILECLNVYYNLVSLFHVSWMVYYFLLEFVTHFSWIQKKYCISKTKFTEILGKKFK